MKKLFLTSAIIAMAICPVFADPAPSYDIDAGDESANCVSDTLHATSGNVNLNANWDPNTVNITYYSDNSEFTTGECVYDQTLTIPETEPTKTGYTFGGWKVRVAQCSLSGLDININASFDSQHIRWKTFNSSGFTMADQGESVDGFIENSSDLSNGEWAETFSYGTIKGEATCSNRKGNSNVYGGEAVLASDIIPADALSAGQYNSTDAQYCWCKATSYTPITNNVVGDTCSVSSPSWVYAGDGGSASFCEYVCPRTCAFVVYGYPEYRKAIYGISQ